MLEPNTYEIPNEKKQRTQWALKQMLPWCAPMAGFLFGWIWVLAHNGLFTLGSGIMFGLVLIGLAIALWGFWWKWKNARFTYELFDSFTVEFASPQYYVPPKKMEAVITEEVLDRFNEHHEFEPGLDAQDVLQGNHLTVADVKPKVDGHGTVLGVTYPFAGQSIVYGPYALHGGVTGHEIRLQVCHALFPGRSEKGDLRWMKEQGIL
jgi:hypothetical protein